MVTNIKEINNKVLVSPYFENENFKFYDSFFIGKTGFLWARWSSGKENYKDNLGYVFEKKVIKKISDRLIECI